MKNFFKFLCGAASMVAVAFGAYCVYKNVIAKKDEDDFDDFDDCFEDETVEADENREYVSINITEEAADLVEEAENAVEEAAEAAADIAEDIADAVKDAVDELTEE